MIKKHLILILSFFMILWIKEGEAKTMHAIIVADTIHDIAFASKPDLKRLQQELKKISKQTGMALNEKVFAGDKFEQQKLRTYLSTFKIEPDDIVVFYFSGHGYRTKENVSLFPNLNFEFYKPGLDLKWVADTIRHKKPQFALVMADCCNQYVEKGFVGETKNIYVNLPCQSPNYNGYRQLFSRAKGCLVVCSSSPGEFSYGSRFGGIFTQYFFACLNQETNEQAPTWKHLLERTRSYIKRIQKPVSELYQ